MLRAFICPMSIEEGGEGGRYIDIFMVWLLLDVVDIAGVAWGKVLVRLHLPLICESPPGPSACTM